MRARVVFVFAFLVLPLFSRAASAGVITLNDYHQFGFTDAGTPATGCDPADPSGSFCFPSSGTPTLFLDAPPWTFVAPSAVRLTVVDVFLSGDRFELFDFGVSIGLTSLPSPDVDCGDDPVPCLATPGMSTGVFLLAAGSHSLTLTPTLSPDGGGSGYLQVAVPEPATWLLLAMGMGLLVRRHLRTHV